MIAIWSLSLSLIFKSLSLSLTFKRSYSMWPLCVLTHSLNNCTKYRSHDTCIWFNLKVLLPLQVFLYKFHFQTETLFSWTIARNLLYRTSTWSLTNHTRLLWHNLNWITSCNHSLRLDNIQDWTLRLSRSRSVLFVYFNALDDCQHLSMHIRPHG